MASEKINLQSVPAAVEKDNKEPYVVYFLSFDLVNSTQFKNEKPTKWFKVITNFYNTVQNSFGYSSGGQDSVRFDVWKLAGDEIILKAKIETISKLEFAVKESYRNLQLLADSIHKEYKILDIKAAGWIAFIDNNKFNYEYGGESTQQVDFIGRSIDEGFRVAGHYAKPRKFTISFELAQLILRLAYIKDFVMFLGYKHLKGVWGGRGYPILWYTENIERDKDNTAYDAGLFCDITQKFLKSSTNEDVSGEFDKIMKTLDEKYLKHYRTLKKQIR